MPFKTKMVPAWKMDKEGLWGKNYPKATYPKREKQEIKLFDIKKVVEEKRQRKIDEMLGKDLPKMPDMPSMPNFNPFDNNPFSKMPGNPNFDDIVKRIDAKIAELEEEERQEKLKEEKKKEQLKEEKIIEEPTTFKQEEVTDDQFFDDFFADDE